DLLTSGDLQLNARVDALVPDLSGTGYGSATVNSLLDMRTAVRYPGGARTPKQIQDLYHAAIGYIPRLSGAPSSLADLLTVVEQTGRHGQQFRYDGVTTEVLAVVIRAITGMSMRE